MTIFVNPDPTKEKECVVVTDDNAVNETKVLAKEKEAEAGTAAVKIHGNAKIVRKRRRRCFSGVVCTLLALLVLLCILVGGLFCYRRFYRSRVITRARCGVDYMDEQYNRRRQHNKEARDQLRRLIEQVRIKDSNTEEITVPRFDECGAAKILNDFRTNLTLIRDLHQKVCYITRLDETTEESPLRFQESLSTMVVKKGDIREQTGVFSVIRRRLVVSKKVVSVRAFDSSFTYHCADVDTYQLIPRPQVATERRVLWSANGNRRRGAARARACRRISVFGWYGGKKYLTKIEINRCHS